MLLYLLNVFFLLSVCYLCAMQQYCSHIVDKQGNGSASMFFLSVDFCLSCTSTEMWLLTCQNRVNHTSTHMFFGKQPAKNEFKQYEEKKNDLCVCMFLGEKMNEIFSSKKRRRTLARIARKMQALHGAIRNRQNHNIDCCTFCRAVNLFARHKHTYAVD